MIDTFGTTLAVPVAFLHFYRAHEAELTKLGELTTQADCDNR
jgi:hypothetical protein